MASSHSRDTRPRVVLCGPPGAGKSTIGRLAARELGVDFRDADAEIEAAAGMPVTRIFAERGEPAFRDLERETIARLLTGFDGVLALGGGAVLDPRTREALAGHRVVLLDVDAAGALERVSRSDARPLLADDPAARLDALLRERRPHYEAVATTTVATGGRPPTAVLRDVLAGLDTPATPDTTATPATSTVHVSGEPGYDVLVGRDLVDDVVAMVPGTAVRALVAHPAAVADHARAIGAALEASGRTVRLSELPDGEDAKTVDVVARMWDELADLQLGRHDAVVAVGGGATTDLAGFAAASWLRGVALVNVPTTLLAMVDASVGGKTGINTSHGKNLVGAFHAPAGVVCDLRLLETLPAADHRAGLGEVVKCGLIADPEILRLVEADGGAAALDPGSAVTHELIERSLAVKARVVGADLRESGLREILNYGHTFAHAVEAVEHFGVRHGEAVAIGLVYAGELAVLEGILDPAVVARTRRVLTAVGLPTSYRGGRWDDLLAAMRLDKKARQNSLRFVVLDDVAAPRILRDPAPENLRAAYDVVSGAHR